MTASAKPGLPPNASPALLSREQQIARGVTRAMGEMGFACLTEFTLGNGRRADVMALDTAGLVAIVEIKTSLEDFRSDRKWPDYLAFCERFYFAVPEDFPRAVLPEDGGILVADSYGAAILRQSPSRRLDPARRRALTLRFARLGAERLARLLDPV